MSVFICSSTFAACGQQQNNNNIREVEKIDSAALYQRSSNLINKLQGKLELQALELSVWQNFQKIDTLQFGTDSIVVLFVGKNDNPAKTIKIRYGKDRSSIRDLEDLKSTKYYGDSIITYTTNGLMEYPEE
ncbi:MAG: hypothetical protein QM727_04425 [Niabella sp.]